VTADHGDALGDHNLKGHGRNLYHEMTHVPLILYFSSGAFSGNVYPQVVSHVDILPTLADLANFEPTQVLPLQGGSILPILNGSEAPGTEHLTFSERRRFDTTGSDLDQQAAYNQHEPGDKFALFDGRFKYIYRSEGEPEFYALEEDPHELDNLIGKGLPEEKILRDKLLKLLAEMPQLDNVETLSVDAETIKALEELGYIQ
jgi:arylsulfatase A-like enzyme